MIVVRFLRVRDLFPGRALMRPATDFLLDLRGLRLDAAPAAERVVRPLDLFHHRAIFVNIVDVLPVHVCDDRVMLEDISLPASPGEAFAEISVAIIDAAVEADILAPISLVPEVFSAGVIPITRRP